MSHVPFETAVSAPVQIELTQTAKRQWSKMAELPKPDDLQLSILVQLYDLITISGSFTVRVDRRIWRQDEAGNWRLSLRLDWPGVEVPR